MDRKQAGSLRYFNLLIDTILRIQLSGGRRSRQECARWQTIQLTSGSSIGVLNPFMKVVSSIKSAKKRHPACQVVRRRGKIYVINKVEPRYKARQG